MFSPLPGSYFKDKSISKQEMIETYSSIADLQKDDVDFFIIETMSSIDEAVSAVEALSNFNKEIYYVSVYQKVMVQNYFLKT